MSGYDDTVNNLVKLVNGIPETERVTPLYGKPSWGISFEIPWSGLRAVPMILEHIINDMMEQYNIHVNEFSVSITPIDSENPRQSVKVIFSEFPSI